MNKKRWGNAGRWRAALALGVLATSAAVAAPAPAMVEALQPPVWIERGGERSALGVGASIEAGDTLHTGPGARLHLNLADDSVVKLGESAAFALPALELRAQEQNPVLRGVLHVLKGAFRYTTRALGTRKRRDLAVSIGGVVTAGIRGTDIWGKSDDEQNLIALIEGRIELSGADGAVQTMDQAGTWYVVPQGRAARAVEPLPPGKLDEFVPQTELAAAPVLRADGAWAVELALADSAPAAEQVRARLDQLGYAAEVREDRAQGRVRQRVRLRGFASAADARAFLHTARRLGFATAWVHGRGR